MLDVHEKLVNFEQFSISIDYETFCFTVISTSYQNLLIVIANDEITKNTEEDLFIFRYSSQNLPWKNKKIKLVKLENKNHENSFV